MRGFVVSVDLDAQGPIASIRHERLRDGTLLHADPFRLVQTAGFPEDDALPITTGDVVCAYTGYVDNRTDLERRLGACDSDGALLVGAHRKWGRSFPRHVHGEYSFLIIDRATGRLLAGRDALGVHRLLYCVNRRRFLAASNLSLLLATIGEPPAYDLDGFSEFIARSALLSSSHRTLFDGVWHVPPAHVIAVSDGKPPIAHNYWSADLDTRLHRADEREYEEELRQLLIESVRAAKHTSRPLWLELSGGLDSSTVCAMAARLQPETPGRTLSAYSLSASETAPADEREYWTAVLDRYPLEHHHFDIDQLSDTLSLAHRSQPAFIDGQMWYLQAQRQLADRFGACVCLSGQGGDALFGQAMPPLHLAESLQTLQLRTWWRDLLKWSRRGRTSIARLLSVYSRGDVHVAFRPPPAPAWLTPSGRARITASQASIFSGLPGRFVSNPRALHFHALATGASALPEPDARVWEFRNPLLNRRLVEFMLGIPEHLKNDADQNRVLQRRALKDILPARVVSRRNKGDFTPRFYKGLRRAWSEWEPLTHGTHLASLGFVDSNRFREACVRLREGQANSELSFLIAALLLEAWLTASATRAQSSTAMASAPPVDSPYAMRTSG